MSLRGDAHVLGGWGAAGQDRSQEVRTVSDDPRTAEQLRAQIAALKRQLEQRGPTAGKRAAKRVPQPLSARAPVSRRSAFGLGLAPVILLAPAAKAAKRWAKGLKRRVAALPSR